MDTESTQLGIAFPAPISYIYARPKSAAMAAVSARPPPLATAEQITDMHARLTELKLRIADRRHGGAGKSGRYKKHDTARVHFIDGQAMRDLSCGKLPSAANQRALFDIPGDDDVTGPQKKEMDAWYDEHYADCRSSRYASAGLSEQRQATLLAWVHANPGSAARDARAPAGAPAAYKLGKWSGYEGYTLLDLVRDGMKKQLTWTSSRPQVPGGQYLKYLCETMTYSFPDHVRLYLGLVSLQRDGAHVSCNGGETWTPAASGEATLLGPR